MIVNQQLNKNNLPVPEQGFQYSQMIPEKNNSQQNQDIGPLLAEQKSIHQNQQLFDKMSQLILFRRNKASFFYLTSLMLYEVYFEDQCFEKDKIDKDLVFRLIYLLCKYAMGKLFKLYKGLKGTGVSPKYLPKQWEHFNQTAQRTHLLNFITFDFEMVQLFHDVFMKYTKQVLKKTIESGQTVDQPEREIETQLDMMFLQSPPSLFQSDFEFKFSSNEYADQIPVENIQMINTFLRHCCKKLRDKNEFEPIIDGTVKLCLYKVPTFTAPSRKLLMSLCRAKYSCQDWRKQLQKVEGFWEKFEENFESKSKEQLLQKLI